MATTSTTQSLFANLPPPAECLAILVGFAEITVFGLAGFANPPSFAKGFGLPVTNSSDSNSSDSKLEAGSATTPQEVSKATKTQQGLILALAARNLEKGLTVMAFACYWRDRKALGTCIFAGLITTAADYLAVKWYGEEEAAFGHVIGIVNCSLIGGALLYWSRDGAW
jgi:L-lactate permease